MVGHESVRPAAITSVLRKPDKGVFKRGGRGKDQNIFVDPCACRFAWFSRVVVLVVVVCFLQPMVLWRPNASYSCTKILGTCLDGYVARLAKPRAALTAAPPAWRNHRVRLRLAPRLSARCCSVDVPMDAQRCPCVLPVCVRMSHALVVCVAATSAATREEGEKHGRSFFTFSAVTSAQKKNRKI